MFMEEKESYWCSQQFVPLWAENGQPATSQTEKSFGRQDSGGAGAEPDGVTSEVQKEKQTGWKVQQSLGGLRELQK